MSNQRILQRATAVFNSSYPSLSAEAFIAFIMIADHDRPSVSDISVAISQPDMQIFQHMAPLRDAGLIALEVQSSGENVIMLTERGQEAKQEIVDTFSG